MSRGGGLKWRRCKADLVKQRDEKLARAQWQDQAEYRFKSLINNGQTPEEHSRIMNMFCQAHIGLRGNPAKRSQGNRIRLVSIKSKYIRFGRISEENMAFLEDLYKKSLNRPK